ncbi:MAG: GDP-mannose 4,6-dehydratase, partial [Deltaproteobacteria bacterium]|nr:GDP-mannose 4,6-dehydratase [Deltaproteobacteria bacterium]
MAYHRYHGVNTRIARIFNTYGPRMRLNDGRVVPNFILQALAGEDLTGYGDGSQTRSFCYVDDLVEGIIRLLFSQETEPVNLGNPDEFSIVDFAQEVLEITGSKSRIVHQPLPVDDPRVRQPDITKARKVLNWNPQVGLREGIRKTVPYFQKKMAGKSI